MSSDQKSSDALSSEGTCRVVRPGSTIVGKQALTYAPAVSAESVGSQGLHMQLVTLPPGARAKAHLHEAHETALHVLSVVAGTLKKQRLEHHLWSRAGDFVYIPAGVPHLPYNASRTETCTAVIARTDPNEQESVVLLPDLDGLRPPEGDVMA